MIGDATEDLKKKGSDWQEDQMELISRCLSGKVGDLHVEDRGKGKLVKSTSPTTEKWLRKTVSTA